MAREYNVDDILNEVLAKKAASEQSDAVRTYTPKQAGSARPAAPIETKQEVPAAQNRFANMREILAGEEPQNDRVKRFSFEQLHEQIERQTETVAQESAAEDFDFEQEDDTAIEDFEAYAQKDSIWKDLRDLKVTMLVRLTVTALCAVLLIAMSLIHIFELPSIAAFSPKSEPVMFLAANIVLTVFSAGICYSTIISGWLGLFRMKANNDTLAAVLPVFCLIQEIALLFQPEKLWEQGVWVFAPIAAIALLCNTVGKMMTISRIASNFRLVSNEKYEKNICEVLDNPELELAMSRALDLDNPVVCISRKTNFLSDFLKISYSEDASDSAQRILAPLMIVGSIVVGVISQIFFKDPYLAIGAACAALCLSTPVAATMSCNFPLLRVNRSLARHGAIISGPESLTAVSDTNCVYLDAADLFPKGTILLHALKTLGTYKIDDCILNAASITYQAKIPLSEVFLNVIQGETKLLKKVDSLVYEDEMGLSAWVDGKRILLGNRELLRTHGVEPPSREFEARYKRDGRELVYLVDSGELAAFFVVSYNADPEIAAALYELYRAKVSILVRSNDCNITARKLMWLFDISDDYIEMVPKLLQQQCDGYLTETMKAPARVAYTGSVIAFIRAVAAAIGIKSSFALGGMLQSGAMILGYAIVCFFAFVQGISQINVLTILVYQLFWLLSILLVPNLKRY